MSFVFCDFVIIFEDGCFICEDDMCNIDLSFSIDEVTGMERGISAPFLGVHNNFWNLFMGGMMSSTHLYYKWHVI
jgi:hypothetical protein